MPVKIRIGGEEYVPTRPEESRVPIDHVTYKAFDEMCNMASARDRAVAMWSEAEALQSEIAERDPEHPSYFGAVQYLARLRAAVTTETTLYLSAERRANLCWQELLPDEREEREIDELFFVLPDRPDLYGLWHLNLPLSDGAPSNFPVDEVALLIAVSPQREVYERMRHGRRVSPKGDD